MRVYEVVKDHKSGHMKVVSYEERPDPFSRPAIRRHDEDTRARVASLKAWWVALRISWSDRSQRTRIAGHALFFVALCVFPAVSAFAGVLNAMLRFGPGQGDELTAVTLVLFAILGLGGAVLWFGPLARTFRDR